MTYDLALGESLTILSRYDLICNLTVRNTYISFDTVLKGSVESNHSEQFKKFIESLSMSAGAFKEVCYEIYGYKTASGVFPSYKKNDLEAAKNILQHIVSILTKKYNYVQIQKKNRGRIIIEKIIIEDEKFINNQVLTKTSIKNEVHRKDSKESRGSIIGEARVSSRRQQISVGSRSKGNVTIAKSRASFIRIREIKGEVIVA